MKRALAVVGALALAACGGDKTHAVHPQLVPPASSFDFGPVPVLNLKTQDIALQNVGLASLNVVSAVIVLDGGAPGADGGAFAVTQAPSLVSSGQTVPVTVSFVPPAQQAYQATLVVTTDDGTNPVVSVSLTGSGSTVAVMQVTPASLSFGRVDEGTSALRSITVASSGTADLILNQLAFTPGTPPSFSFLGSVATPATVKMGAQTQLTLKYTAAAGSLTGADGGVEITGTDPLNRHVIVPLSAGLNRAPIPIIAPLGNGAPGMTVALDGSGSSDPDGDTPLTYKWTLVNEPLSATTQIQQPTQAITQMTLDSQLPGEYDLTLDVTDSAGAKNLQPAKASIVAVPAQKLLIELFQDNPNTDLDIHFLRTQTSALGTAPDDCYFANPNPNWAVSGPADGPVVTRDALTGYGPDLTGYDNPIDSTYRVVVGFTNDHLDVTPATTATVRIYEFGQEKAELKHSLAKQGDFWPVADIAWPTGTITPL